MLYESIAKLGLLDPILIIEKGDVFVGRSEHGLVLVLALVLEYRAHLDREFAGFEGVVLAARRAPRTTLLSEIPRNLRGITRPAARHTTGQLSLTMRSMSRRPAMRPAVVGNPGQRRQVTYARGSIANQSHKDKA